MRMIFSARSWKILADRERRSRWANCGLKALPCSGGGYFRLYPYWFSRWALKHVNEVEGRPAIFYCHPWEIDPGQPRQEGIGLRTRFRHYQNLERMEGRLHRLLQDFTWSRVDQVFPEACDDGP